MNTTEFINTIMTIWHMKDPELLDQFIEIHKDVWYNTIKELGFI